jgi:Protein of unknown function (DUF3533)
MSAEPETHGQRPAPPARRPTGVRAALDAPGVWAPPMVLIALLVSVMTLVYLGSIIDPSGRLEGLPVAVVDQDGGYMGRQITAGLASSPAIGDRLALEATDLAGARRRMDRGAVYATVVIPAGLTRSLQASQAGASETVQPATRFLTNPRAGTVGVSLAVGVLTPAVAAATEPLARGPASVQQVVYRPLPQRSGLGLSAFYIALLITFCGFLGGVIVHTALDGVLGYATIEIGPRWQQRQPVPISRWHTLLAKWIVVVPLTLVLTGLMLLVATIALNMDTPHVLTLWLLAWFSAAVVGIGTVTLFAVLGTPGQIAALLIFVYLALASAGGTVPLQALGSVFRFFAEFEPLRQIIAGTRSILYFDASGAAGLTRAFVGAGAGLVVWLAVGTWVTRWYDRRDLDRASPRLLEHIDAAVRSYREPT